MAGVVIGDFAMVSRALTSAATDEIGSNDFGDVFDLRAESFAAIVAERMTVFLEGRAAAGGVDHDGIHVFESADVVAGAFTRALQIAAVSVQGAAADLSVGRDDVVAGAIEPRHRRGVRLAKHDTHDATADQADGAAFRAVRG